MSLRETRSAGNHWDRPPVIRKYRKEVAAVAICILVLWFWGCASPVVNSDALLPEDLPENWSAPIMVDSLPVTAHLLDLIEVRLLRALVVEALENNPNLQATALRLKASGYLLAEPRSRLLPRVGVTMSGEHHNQGINSRSGKPQTVDTYRPSLGIQWELDLWGRLSDEMAASKYALGAQTDEYRQARDALAARVIQAWIEQAAIQSSLAIEQKRVEVLKCILTVLVQRYKNGIASLDEFSEAKTRMEIARADLSERRASRLRVLRNLEILLGRYPRGELLPGTKLPKVAVPPIDGPAAVLLKRPDIQAAVARYHEAYHYSHSAKKALLPGVNISGDIFKEGARLSMLGSATTYWRIVGSLFQPLFENGRIINTSHARHEQAKAALMDLREVVLGALKEAEDAIDRERDLGRQIKALEIAVQESEKSSRYYDERYRQGIDSLQSLLHAREQEMAVKLRLNDVIAQRLSNRVDMAIALGAGLKNESKQ